MAHNLTLSTYLVPNLANPLSTAKLIAAQICQLQRCENDLVAIIANDLNVPMIQDINNYITDLSPGPLPCLHLYIHPSHPSSQLERSGVHLLPTKMLGVSSLAVRQQDTPGPAVGQWDTLSTTIGLVRHSL